MKLPFNPLTTNTKINGRIPIPMFFATDTFSVFDWMHINASMNWMQAQVQTTDQIGTALNGKNVYARVNPSCGFYHQSI